MKFISADPRDGTHGGPCDTCCCQAMTLRPGETDIVIINYAPWIVPIGNGAQLLPQLDVAYEYDASACSAAPIDGYAPPSHVSQTVVVLANTATNVDLNDDANQSPVGNTFSYRVHPNFGPTHGSITPYGSDFVLGDFVYTPVAGWAGDDIVWFDQKDAQGRINTFPVRFRTGAGGPVVNIPTNAVRIDLTKVSVNPRTYEMSFPLGMPPGVPQCVSQRVTLKATARDCAGRLFTHFTCLDVASGRC